MTDIATLVREEIADQLGVNEDQVSDAGALMEDLGQDSLDSVELLMTFEERFRISIGDDEAEGCRTVGDWIALVERKASAKLSA